MYNPIYGLVSFMLSVVFFAASVLFSYRGRQDVSKHALLGAIYLIGQAIYLK